MEDEATAFLARMAAIHGDLQAGRLGPGQVDRFFELLAWLDAAIDALGDPGTEALGELPWRSRADAIEALLAQHFARSGRQ
jgi:hypothetical protein